MKKIIVLIAFLAVFIKVSALEETDTNSNLKFNVNEEFWVVENPDELIGIVDGIKYYYTNDDCGMMFVYIRDVYSTGLSSEEKSKYSRNQFNPGMVTDEYVKEALNDGNIGENYKLDSWNIVKYNINMAHMYGTYSEEGYQGYFDRYFTMSNGYSFNIEYIGIKDDTCLEKVKNAAETINYIDSKLVNEKDNAMSNSKKRNKSDIWVYVAVGAFAGGIGSLVEKKMKQKNKKKDNSNGENV